MVDLPLIIDIFWPQRFRIRKKCHSAWSHLGIDTGMGGDETLDQFMRRACFLLQSQGKGASEESPALWRHAGFVIPQKCPKLGLETAPQFRQHTAHAEDLRVQFPAQGTHWRLTAACIASINTQQLCLCGHLNTHMHVCTRTGTHTQIINTVVYCLCFNK